MTEQSIEMQADTQPGPWPSMLYYLCGHRAVNAPMKSSDCTAKGPETSVQSGMFRVEAIKEHERERKAHLESKWRGSTLQEQTQNARQQRDH